MAESNNRIYSALDISKYIINKCTVENFPISNLQLQKILYFIQKEYLRCKNRVLFKDEIQAWQFGPVVPEVYYQYCGFGSMAITMKYLTSVEDEDKKQIDLIVEKRRCQDPWDLVEETHSPGRAWYEVYDNGNGNHKIIPINLIKIKG